MGVNNCPSINWDGGKRSEANEIDKSNFVHPVILFLGMVNGKDFEELWLNSGIELPTYVGLHETSDY